MSDETWRLLDEDHAGFEELARGRGEPVSEDELKAAMAELGLVFPPAYRDFLLRLGAATVGSLHVWGLRPTGVSDALLLDQNRFYRNQSWPGIDDWIIISDDGAGNPIGIDPCGRVLRSDHNVGFSVDVLANTFEEFVRQQCIVVNE